MSNLIPYISSEPPPISNDSFDHDSYNLDAFSLYKSRDSVMNSVSPNEEMEVDCYSIEDQNIEPFHYENYGKENYLEGSRNPVELYQYIENVIVQNNLRPDMTDSGAVKESDNLSEHSYDGEYDEYISKTCFKTVHSEDNSVTNNPLNTTNNIDVFPEIGNPEATKFNLNTAVEDKTGDIVSIKSDSQKNVNENEKTDDFGDFAFISDNSQTDYFSSSNNEEVLNTNANVVNYFTNLENEPFKTKSDDFANFTDFANFSQEGFTELIENDLKDKEKPCNIDNFDDDFEDFATFENSLDNTISPSYVPNEKDQSENSQETLENVLEKILTEFSSLKCDLNTENETYSTFYTSSGLTVDQSLFNDSGLLLWKELINYDYSPAFIFQWMQSATYEKFMSSIGPEYKEILSSHRAALPLFSVNLTPIEPVPADNSLSMIASASSSNIDLAIKDDCIVNPSERNSTIDFKNLEDEFIFDKFSNPTDIPVSDNTVINSSSMSNLSSTVIQSERFGILKSILKPLNSSKSSPVNKPMSPQIEAVLKDLPDLSYMSSKVLMFPVISTCDVEDNI